MPIPRSSRRRAPETDEYYDEEEKDTRVKDDEEEEDEPRPARRRRRTEDEEDEPRSSRRRRQREEDDEEEEESPLPSDDDDEEEEPPARRSRRRKEDVEEEEDDEADSSDSSSLVQSGWGAAKKAMKESSSFTDEFVFDEESQVVKFLTEEPMVYQQHWIDNRVGKKSFVCRGRGCPLCAAGDSPTNKFAFGVLNFGLEGAGDEPRVQLLVCGTKLARQLEKLDNDKRNGPLTKNYFEMSRAGQRQQVSYTVAPIKERDLPDWDIDPDEAAEAVAAAHVPDETAIKSTPLNVLRDVARELR